jgi:hypothetical protein
MPFRELASRAGQADKLHTDERFAVSREFSSHQKPCLVLLRQPVFEINGNPSETSINDYVPAKLLSSANNITSLPERSDREFTYAKFVN